MLHSNRGHRIDTIFVLIIFCVFAVSVLMVLMLGASTYEHVTAMSREDYAGRAVLSYIWTKVKNSDDVGKVHIGEFHGLPALYIDEEIGQMRYRTAVYRHDGWVCELFYEADLEFYPEAGSQIISIDDLTFEQLESGLIKVSSGTGSLLIFPRGNVSTTNARAAFTGMDEGEIIFFDDPVSLDEGVFG